MGQVLGGVVFPPAGMHNYGYHGNMMGRGSGAYHQHQQQGYNYHGAGYMKGAAAGVNAYDTHQQMNSKMYGYNNTNINGNNHGYTSSNQHGGTGYNNYFYGANNGAHAYNNYHGWNDSSCTAWKPHQPIFSSLKA